MTDLSKLLSLSIRANKLGVKVKTLKRFGIFHHAYVVKGEPKDVGIGLTTAGAVEDLLDRVEAETYRRLHADMTKQAREGQR